MPKSVTRAQPTHPKKSGCGGRENGGGEMTFPRLVRPLLDLVASGAERGAGDSVEVIDREIESLMRAREYFLQWVTLLREEERVDGGESGSSDRAGQSARQKGARPGSQSKRLGFSPGQFLRAWSESTWRVVQLLKARQRLAGSGQHQDYAELVDAVLADLEALPGLQSGADGSSPADTDDEKGGV